MHPPTPPPGAMGGRQAARGHALRRKPDPMQQLPAGYPSREGSLTIKFSFGKAH